MRPSGDAGVTAAAAALGAPPAAAGPAVAPGGLGTGISGAAAACGDYCSQQQRDDGHEVKVPLRSQELVHIQVG